MKKLLSLLFLAIWPFAVHAADKSIAELDPGSAVSSGDLFVTVQYPGAVATTMKVTSDQLKTWATSGLIITTTTGALTVSNGKTLATSGTGTLTLAGTGTLNINGGGTLGTGAFAAIYTPPQALGTGDSPTFGGLTLNGDLDMSLNLVLAASGVFYDGAVTIGSAAGAYHIDGDGSTVLGATTADTLALSSATEGTIAGFDGDKNLQSISLGTGLSFDGTTLSATGGSTVYVSGIGLTQSGTGTVTFAIDTSLIPTLTGTQTLTNKSISGSQINSGSVPLAQLGLIYSGTGTFTTPQTFLSTTSPQIKIGYDGSNYFTYAVTSTGSVTMAATGTSPSITLTGTGGIVANGVRVDPVIQTWDGSADVTVSAATTLLRLTAQTTANRTITLPAANAYPGGTALVIDTGVGIGNTKTVTIQRAGSDNIVGLDGTNVTSLSLGQSKGLFTLVRDGSSKWTPDNTSHADIFGTILAPAFQTGNAIFQGSGKVLGLPSDYLVKWSNSTSAFFSGTPDVGWARNAAGVMEVNNGTSGTFRDLIMRTLICGTAGSGLAVKEGSNAKQGTATLVAGTVTVSNTAVTANSRILLTAQDNNSTGALRISARTAATSFTITSSNSGDTGVVAYEIFEPAP